MRKLAIVVLMLMFGLGLVAQEAKDNKPARSGQFFWTQGVYRLEYVIKELDDAGKVVNSRSYAMLIEATDSRAGGRESLKTGTRVPVATASKEGGTQFQYIDVGFNMDAQLFALEDSRLMLESTIEISTLTANEAPATQNLPAPAIRQVRAATTGEVLIGKSNQITSLDDVVSKHRFVIEVTPTKLK